MVCIPTPIPSQRPSFQTVVPSLSNNLPEVTSYLRCLDALGGVGLVWGDSVARGDLLVGIGREDDEALSVVDNSEGGELVAGAELVRPARGDCVRAAVDGAAVERRGLGALDDLGAGGVGRAVVDAEGPGSDCVVGVEDPLHAGDGPLLGLGHHGDCLGPGLERSSHGADGGEGREEDGGELHFDYGIIIITQGV